MGQEIIIKIEGMDELTKAIISLTGTVMDYQAFMEKSGQRVELTSVPLKGMAEIIKEIDKKLEEEYEPEIATRDMYYFNKAKNGMIKIAKGQPIDVPVGYKATTKAKYDEYYGEDGVPADGSSVTPSDEVFYEVVDDDDDKAPWEDDDDETETVTMEDVRSKFVALDKATEKGAAKKILTALKVDKLMDMDPKDYPKAIQMAEDALKKAGK